MRAHVLQHVEIRYVQFRPWNRTKTTPSAMMMSGKGRTHKQGRSTVYFTVLDTEPNFVLYSSNTLWSLGWCLCCGVPSCSLESRWDWPFHYKATDHCTEVSGDTKGPLITAHWYRKPQDAWKAWTGWHRGLVEMSYSKSCRDRDISGGENTCIVPKPSTGSRTLFAWFPPLF